MSAVDRATAMWALVLFFGASIAFRAVQAATDDESLWVTIGLELLLLGAIIAAIVVFVRRRDRP